MTLSKKQLKFLRARCHALHPVIMLGQKGMTDELLNELDLALDHHELVKIRLSVDDREQRRELAGQICARTGAEAVQSIGKTLSVYRRNRNDPVIDLPR